MRMRLFDTVADLIDRYGRREWLYRHVRTRFVVNMRHCDWQCSNLCLVDRLNAPSLGSGTELCGPTWGRYRG